jgi:hypothetical protein
MNLNSIFSEVRSPECEARLIAEKLPGVLAAVLINRSLSVSRFTVSTHLSLNDALAFYLCWGWL